MAAQIPDMSDVTNPALESLAEEVVELMAMGGSEEAARQVVEAAGVAYADFVAYNERMLAIYMQRKKALGKAAR
jgi:hypothetical protein